MHGRAVRAGDYTSFHAEIQSGNSLLKTFRSAIRQQQIGLIKFYRESAAIAAPAFSSKQRSADKPGSDY